MASSQPSPSKSSVDDAAEQAPAADARPRRATFSKRGKVDLRGEHLVAGSGTARARRRGSRRWSCRRCSGARAPWRSPASPAACSPAPRRSSGSPRASPRARCGCRRRGSAGCSDSALWRLAQFSVSPWRSQATAEPEHAARAILVRDRAGEPRQQGVRRLELRDRLHLVAEPQLLLRDVEQRLPSLDQVGVGGQRRQSLARDVGRTLTLPEVLLVGALLDLAQGLRASADDSPRR